MPRFHTASIWVTAILIGLSFKQFLRFAGVNDKSVEVFCLALDGEDKTCVSDGDSVRTTTGASYHNVPATDNVACHITGHVTNSDNSQSHVPAGKKELKIPLAYIEQYKGDVNMAQQKWDETKKWRTEEGVGNILKRPHLLFPQIKDVYPHYIHGLSKDGYPVVYEQPGKMSLKALFRSGRQVSDMIKHYIFFMEYLCEICKNPDLRSGFIGHSASSEPVAFPSGDCGFVVVMDMTGVSVSILSADVLRYMHQAGEINAAHYPRSMKRVFAVNVAGILAVAWGGVKKLVPKSGNHPPEILCRDFITGLHDHIELDQIPPEFGGSSPYALEQHPFEHNLVRLVENLNEMSSGERNR